MIVYMAVTNNRLELPLAITDTPQELADLLGVKKNTVLAEISRGSNKPYSTYKCIRVEIDDTEDD